MVAELGLALLTFELRAGCTSGRYYCIAAVRSRAPPTVRLVGQHFPDHEL